MDSNLYSRELLANIRTDAAINRTDAGDEFVVKSLDLLESIGELTDPIQFYFGKSGRNNRMMQIDGYAFDDADRSLTLLISDFEDSFSPENLTRSRIDILYKRMLNFLDEAYSGNLQQYCDDADDTIKLGRLIKSKLNDDDGLLKIRFFIITNKKRSDNVKKLKEDTFNGKPVELNLWPIERFFEVENAFSNEPIVIDIKNDFNSKGIPCLRGHIGEDLGYNAFIAIIPGKLLADIYIEYGSKILEGNVRAFLGTGGSKSVNSGIKRTIITEPSKFFTYNNGISVTSSRVELQQIGNEIFITKIEDMQIINGGQTTASLATAVLKKENVSLEGIFVPMKLTVIEDRETVDEEGIKIYDLMVQNISRYANSQNKVTAADFFSNSPYHIYMERMSKKHFAPPANGSPIPTGWYYERSRKKYEQEQIKMTKGEKEKFSQKYPKKQIIKKEELAKYIYSVECKPYIVSRGSNWTMKDFGVSINEAYQKNKNTFNEFYFKKSICSAIIFRTVDKMVSTASWYQKGGYKLNIVPYTISKIFSSISDDRAIDWQRIWNQQSLYPSFVREIEVVSKMTNDFIIQSNNIIVTEYCKRKETWEEFKKLNYHLSIAFINDLVSLEEINDIAESSKREQKLINDISQEVEIYKKGSDYWKSALELGVSKGVLSHKDVSLLSLAADLENANKSISTLQAKAILQIRDKLYHQGIID